MEIFDVWCRVMTAMDLVQPADPPHGARRVANVVDVDLTDSLGFATGVQELLDGVRDTVGRHAIVDDIAPVIAFLGSSDAGWINGQDTQVDGGFTASLFNQPPIPV